MCCESWVFLVGSVRDFFVLDKNSLPTRSTRLLVSIKLVVVLVSNGLERVCQRVPSENWRSPTAWNNVVKRSRYINESP